MRTPNIVDIITGTPTGRHRPSQPPAVHPSTHFTTAPIAAGSPPWSAHRGPAPDAPGPRRAGRLALSDRTAPPRRTARPESATDAGQGPVSQPRVYGVVQRRAGRGDAVPALP